MKIRSGFVSNSSSSSFIVAVDKDSKRQKRKIVLTLELDLENFADKKISTLEELLKYYKDNYGYDIDDIITGDRYFRESYQKAKKALDEGKVLLLGRFASDSGDPIEEFLCDNGLPKDIEGVTIIDNEPGY